MSQMATGTFFHYSSSFSPFLSFLAPDTSSVHRGVRFPGRRVAFLESWDLYLRVHVGTRSCTPTPTKSFLIAHPEVWLPGQCRGLSPRLGLLLWGLLGRG